MFMAVMLWLGFWLKLTIHLSLGYPFSEPVGIFKSSIDAWDGVLTAATLGGFGVLAGRLLYTVFRQPSTIRTAKLEFNPPVWYSEKRRAFWALLLICAVFIAAANGIYGIQQAGLVPRTVLPWPLNAVIYWLLSYGFAIAVATLLWWDICLGRKINWVIYVVLIEGVLSAISLLSRASYIFHVFPQLLVFLKNKVKFREFSRKHIVLLLFSAIVLLMISLRGVNALRAYYYSGAPIAFFEAEDKGASQGMGVLYGKYFSRMGLFILQTSQFAIDRWVGVEGVMAVHSYPEKSWSLFSRQLTEKSEIGRSSIYQEICMAHYRFMNLAKYQFSSLPGPIAFLYSSGFLWMVFVGIAALTLFVLASENLVFYLTTNPFMSALWGGAAANAVMQMGVAPIGLLKFFLIMLLGIVTVRVIQSNWLSKCLCGVKCLRISRVRD